MNCELPTGGWDPWCRVGQGHTVGVDGAVYSIFWPLTGESCGPGLNPRRVELRRHDGDNDTLVAFIEARCNGNGMDEIGVSADGNGVLTPINIYEYDRTNGRIFIPLVSMCRGCPPGNYGDRLWMATIGGFTTTFEILQSYIPASNEISFRVPYMPEGLPAADWFDTYYGAIGNYDFAEAQPLQCGYPSTAPTVGDYLTVEDPLPTSPAGEGRWYLTAVTHLGETRYGRSSSSGVLRGRDPGLLPLCAE